VLLSWYAKCYKNWYWYSLCAASGTASYHCRRKSGRNSGDEGADPENLVEVMGGVWGERKGLERVKVTVSLE